MKSLSARMEHALLEATPEWERKPWSVREGTSIALEDRGLVETEFRHSSHLVGGTGTYWRRTVDGENLALEISLAREGSTA